MPDLHKRRISELFDGSAERYSREREREQGFRAQADWIVRVAGPRPGLRVLEVGCGAGSLLGPFTSAGCFHVGVDLSAEMIRRFARRVGEEGRPLRAARADAEQLPFRQGAFDRVVALGVLEYLADPGALLREAARVLRPQGRLLLSVPSAVSPHALAAGAFLRLPHRWRARLLGRDASHPLHVVRARPARLSRLRAHLADAGFQAGAFRFSRFVFFPLDRLAPGPSRALAGWLEPLGTWPVVSRLGSQILLEAVRQPEANPARLHWERKGAWSGPGA